MSSGLPPPDGTHDSRPDWSTCSTAVPWGYDQLRASGLPVVTACGPWPLSTRPSGRITLSPSPFHRGVPDPTSASRHVGAPPLSDTAYRRPLSTNVTDPAGSTAPRPPHAAPFPPAVDRVCGVPPDVAVVFDAATCFDDEHPASRVMTATASDAARLTASMVSPSVR